MTIPYYQDEFGTLYCGKAEEIIHQFNGESIDCVMTSPPYWMARKYVADDELGQEPDFRAYVQNLSRIFYYIKPKMKESGNLFVNIGDKYFSKTMGTGGKNPKQMTNSASFFSAPRVVPLLPNGTLTNIPNRFSIYMQDYCGWIHKHSIIWYKPNAFPTSNKRKFTLDYEYLFHFILHPTRYYFEQQFEPSTQSQKDQARNILRTDNNLKDPYKANAPRVGGNRNNLDKQLSRGRNKRSVWSIPIGTERAGVNHIAMYPRELVRTPLWAGCPVGGIVLDPFMGSGTTALEAESQGKKWIGIEQSQEYCDEAIQRIIGGRNGRTTN